MLTALAKDSGCIDGACLLIWNTSQVWLPDPRFEQAFEELTLSPRARERRIIFVDIPDSLLDSVPLQEAH